MTGQRGGAGRLTLIVCVALALATLQSCTCAASHLVVSDASSEGSTDSAASDAEAPDVEAFDAALSECELAANSHSVAGCEYWTFSPNRLNEFGCGAVLISNISATDAYIAVTYKGTTLDPTQFMELVQGTGLEVTYTPLMQPTIPSGQTALIALFQGKATGLACPFTTPTSGVMVPIGSPGDAFRITSTVPVAAVFDHAYADIQDHAEGATALRSVGSWDSRYRDVGTYEPGRPTVQQDFGYAIDTYPTWTAAVASATSTVTFAATASGEQAFALVQGNVITLAQDDSFIGSLVTSASPFALWTASNTEIPFDWSSNDINILQFAPVADWATEYAAVRFPTRYPPTDVASMWRIVGDADGTALTYDPAQPVGAPPSINAGQLSIFRAGDPFVVRSQDKAHLFHVTQVMTGCADALGDADAAALYAADGGQIEGCPGDPEIQGTPPFWEYANHYVFFTDPAYPTTKLVFIRAKDAIGFHDVALDCAGTLAGWTAIGADDYEYLYITLSDGDFVPQMYAGGTCNNGPHVADSAGPFSIAVWQWGTYVANVPGVIYYDNASVGFLVPGLTVSPRASNDGGVN